MALWGGVFTTNICILIRMWLSVNGTLLEPLCFNPNWESRVSNWWSPYDYVFICLWLISMHITNKTHTGIVKIMINYFDFWHIEIIEVPSCILFIIFFYPWLIIFSHNISKYKPEKWQKINSVSKIDIILETPDNRKWLLRCYIISHYRLSNTLGTNKDC